MAYQAKRKERITEDFELVDELGDVVHTLHVSIDVDDKIRTITRKYTALTKALHDTEQMKRETDKAKDVDTLQNCLEILGRAVVDVLEAVFGTEDAKIIIDFYDGRYVEMSQEVLPFISTVLIPRMLKQKEVQRKIIASKYNRKQRRTLFKGMR